MFKKILNLLKRQSIENGNITSSFRNSLNQTFQEILGQHTKAVKKQNTFSFSSVNTSTKRPSNDNFAEYLLRCTFANLQDPSSPALVDLVNNELVNLTPKEWSKLDHRYRLLVAQYVRCDERQYFLNKLDAYRSNSLALVFTMWPDGYVREAAIIQLTATEPSANHLIPLILRLNDWNHSVFDAAKQAVHQLIRSVTGQELIPSIPALVRLAHCGRHLTKSTLNDIINHYRANIPLKPLLSQLQTTDARAVAELLWSSSSLTPLTDEILIALCACSDPYIKFNTLKKYVPLLEKESHEKLILSLPHTNWTPAKLERLEQLRKLNSPPIIQEWISGLTDHSQSVRHHCRFYLMKEGLNIESHYVMHLRSSDFKEQRNALSGLEEIKSHLSHEYFKQWLGSKNQAKISVALKLIDNAEANIQRTLITQSLKSTVPALRKAAFIAAKKLDSTNEFETLAWDSSLPPRNQQYAAKLAMKADLWHSLLVSLKLVEHHDSSIQSTAKFMIERNVRNFCNTFTRPEETLEQKILRQLSIVENHLSDRWVREIKAILPPQK